MIGKIVPVLMLLIGVIGGGGIGYFLKPEHGPAENGQIASLDSAHDEEQHLHQEDTKSDGQGSKIDEESEAHDYVKLNNQFVVPVVNADKVEALVVLSLSVEVKPGENDKVYAIEPKLRDAFLQVLFDHANMGGFRGAFTSSNNMKILRRSLLEKAGKTSGGLVSDVLITDIARQDI
ncbi:flagellar basal body-associated FliL family protein [Rhodalgimonas zhirmunskyi]|uniref:Flagellar protein FliL n=1 Tax=Rhodalgimonas zhirmunskyi TaxID=2964767 RepID=A0AAJ1U5H3_9RHOB|nr:flagellar basal body-associated FliL family protein [Rhodoalgimonas zhirmunskyi]MDQ2093985.1 flagellar basal body-associated FliL family protein [Rhodoalgimonas zhirmunskyi]